MSAEKYTLILGDDEVLYFPKHSDDKNKYIVFTCAKNENEYIIKDNYYILIKQIMEIRFCLV